MISKYILLGDKTQVGFETVIFVPEKKRCWKASLCGVILLIFIVLLTVLCIYCGVRIFTTKKEPEEVKSLNLANYKNRLMESQRLPTIIKPIRYVLNIKLYLPSKLAQFPVNKEFIFEGNVAIELHCFRKTANVTLNSVGLTYDMTMVNLTHSSGNVHYVTALEERNSSEQIILHVQPPLEAGENYTVQFGYQGALGDDLRGFYRSQFKDRNEIRWMAVTQFEVSDARRVLPCFDEPSFKAKFQVTLIHPYDLVALANAEERYSVSAGPGWRETIFWETPIMSTYLLAFTVGPLLSTVITHNDILYRTWSSPNTVTQTRFATEHVPKLMTFYSDYFSMNYSLKKLDQVAVPDFSAGAMENWGLITYKDRFLLYDEHSNSLRDLQTIIIVLAHELSHMWFGNFVTMKWWDDLWLNEGFATYMEYIGAENMTDGRFHMWDQFVNIIDTAMQRDQLASTRPICRPFQTIEEITQSFDAIAYEKGAAIIQMLNFTIGESTFRKGINNYLKKFQYKNADHNDLWSCFTEVIEYDNILGWDASALNVTAFMDRWILQDGMPVVEMRRDSIWPEQVILSQSFFTMTNITSTPKLAQADDGYNHAWYIPLWITTKANTSINTVWLEPGKETTIFAPYDGWLLANPDWRGYYRVNYDANNWRLLADELYVNDKAFSPRTKANLLSDAFNLAKARRLPYQTVLSLARYLKMEEHYVPWSIGLPAVLSVLRLFATASHYGQMQKYIRTMIAPQYRRLGWSGASINKTNILTLKLHELILPAACQSHQPDCVKEALRQYEQLVKNCPNPLRADDCSESSIPPSHRSTVYCTAQEQGSVEVFDYLWKRFLQESAPLEQKRLLEGMACANEIWLLIRLLDYALDKNRMRVDDAAHAFYFVGKNSNGAAMYWDYILSRWTQIQERFLSTPFYAKYFVDGIIGSLNSRSKITQFTEFITAHASVIADARTHFDQALEEAKVNVDWIENSAPDLAKWLSENENNGIDS